ncbi:hypothetical protein [Enterovibrio calviensis]|uniref:hypothetical protein n=1 Tax=Enterovibrio calviensis TaxID=91359 RepID=UPI00048813FF|nr:hypothetical protein [Enterovibrio calviensis]
MTAPFKDEEIVALYKESATETPSDDLDNRILGYAEAQTQAQAKAKTQTRKHMPWWTYAGIAATVGFVALLAPWTWVDQSLQSPIQHELMKAPVLMDNVEQADSLELDATIDAVIDAGAEADVEAKIAPAEEQIIRKSAPSEASRSMKFQFAPQEDASAAMKALSNPFEAVENLLAAGEKQKAIALLKQQLEEKPELLSELPLHLERLLDEDSAEKRE